MSPSRVAEVLAEVFQTYGFDTCLDSEPQGARGTTYRVDLVVERAGMDALLNLEGHGGPAGATVVENAAAMREDTGHRYIILVSLAGFSDAAYDRAAAREVILWDRHALQQVIGRAVLHEILSPDEEPPIAEILAASCTGTEPGARLEAAPPTPTTAISTPSAAQEAAFEPMGFGLDLLDGAVEAPAPSDASLPATGPSTTTTPEATSTLGTMVSEALARDDAGERERGPPAEASIDLHPEAADGRGVPTGDDPEVTEGRGWVLETSRVVRPKPVEDPDPTPLVSPSARTTPRPHGMEGIPRMGHNGNDPRTFNPSTGALLAPTVSKDAAARMAKERIFTVDHTWLRYHPKRVMRWEVDAYVEGQVDTKTLRGVAVVDTATRKIAMLEAWEPSRNLREGTFDVPVDHKPVRLDVDKVRQIALRHVLEETAREVTMEDYDAGLDLIVTEKRRIRAHADDVRFTDEGLHWCPVWCFKGVNGAIEVDGLDGAIVEEQLSGPATETIVL